MRKGVIMKGIGIEGALLPFINIEKFQF